VVVLKFGFVDFTYLSQISHFSCEIGGFSGFLNVGFWRVVRGRFWSLLSVSGFFFYQGWSAAATMGPVKCLKTVPAQVNAHQSFHANDVSDSPVLPGPKNILM
jgi:hypothetical protein